MAKETELPPRMPQSPPLSSSDSASVASSPEYCGWVSVPSKGEFVKKWAVTSAKDIVFYSDTNKEETTGRIRKSDILSVIQCDDGPKGSAVVALWRTNCTIYYLLLPDQREAKGLRGALEYGGLASEQSRLSDVNTLGGDFLFSSVRRRVTYPIPGPIIHQFSTVLIKGAVKYHYRLRQDLMRSAQKLESLWTNVVCAPLSLYSVLSVYWLGSASETRKEMSRVLFRLPSYSGRDMGEWRFESKQVLKQQRIWFGRMDVVTAVRQDEKRRKKREKRAITAEERKTDRTPDGDACEETEDDTSLMKVEIPDLDGSVSGSDFGGTTPVASGAESNGLFHGSKIWLDECFRLQIAMHSIFKENVRHAALFEESKLDEIAIKVNDWARNRTMGRLEMNCVDFINLDVPSVALSVDYFDVRLKYDLTEDALEMDRWYCGSDRGCAMKDNIKYFGCLDPMEVPCYVSDDDDGCTVISLDLHLSGEALEMLGPLKMILVQTQFQTKHEEEKSAVSLDSVADGKASLARPPLGMAKLSHALNKAKKRPVRLKIPEMHIDSSNVDFSSTMNSQMGVNTLLDPITCDLTAMAKNAKDQGLRLGQLHHCVEIHVDGRGESLYKQRKKETGHIEVSSLEEDQTCLHLNFDYPFDLYVINDNRQLLLFYARIVDPQKSVPFSNQIIRQTAGDGSICGCSIL